MVKNASSKFEYVPCDICESDNWEIAASAKDNTHGIIGRFNIVRCRLCGLLYTNPRPKTEQVPDLYNGYYSEGNLQKENFRISLIRRNKNLRRLYHWICGQYLSEILSKSKGKALDIGCGDGRLLSELIEMGCDGFGIEPNPKAVQTCVRKGLKVVQGTLDFLDLPPNFFDTVILWHVIEHLPSPKEALKGIYKILKEKGCLFVYCPNADSYMARYFNDNWRGWHLPYHYYHFSPTTFGNLLNTTDFKTYSIKSVTPDFIFPESLRYYLKDGGCLQKRIMEKNLLSSVISRSFFGLLFRLLDTFLPMQGECLQIKLRKD